MSSAQVSSNGVDGRKAENPAVDPPSSTPRREPVVRVEHLAKRFKRGDGTVVNAIDDVSLEVHAGDFVVLLGPSGCGKTTLLRSIAGLEEPDAGTIHIHGSCQFSSGEHMNVPPQRRRLGMIFQSYALWPHMTALRNVSYPLECSPSERIPKKEIKDRVRRVLDLVGIAELEGQYPNQMSGGQQQRVALARALVAGNDLVLFDEPLSNVDAKVREQLRMELATMQRQLGFAALYVTHDQTEAMELAHQIAVMKEGKIAQLGPPREIYEAPRSRYVANFIGTTNELAGEVVSAAPDDRIVIRTALGEAHGRAAEPDLRPGTAVVAVWRPERGVISTDETSAVNSWKGTVEASLFVGSHTEHLVHLREGSVRLWQASAELFQEKQPVMVHVPPDGLRVLRLEDGVDEAMDADDAPTRDRDDGPGQNVTEDSYLVAGQ